MKKFVGVLAAALLVACLGIVGCSSDSKDSSANTNSAVKQEANKADSKYAVTIDDCVVSEDYQGKPAAVVTYTWTNNSDKATSFLVAIHAQAFQNGVELEHAIMMKDIDSQKAMSDIKPGATLTVQEAYVLSDESEVSVECREFISFNDALLAEKAFSVA